jgi:hypothetical protein
MFPQANINGAVTKAQQAINGTSDTLEGVTATAKRLGIDGNMINNIYGRYGNTLQAKAICRALGTTPEALRADANRIVGDGGIVAKNATVKFPRLK